MSINQIYLFHPMAPFLSAVIVGLAAFQPSGAMAQSGMAPQGPSSLQNTETPANPPQEKGRLRPQVPIRNPVAPRAPTAARMSVGDCVGLGGTIIGETLGLCRLKLMCSRGTGTQVCIDDLDPR